MARMSVEHAVWFGLPNQRGRLVRMPLQLSVHVAHCVIAADGVVVHFVGAAVSVYVTMVAVE